MGGILADDMGLGKTLQVLTWIAADHAGQTLVVCPVTLVDTWVRQAQQFTPDLRVQACHGADRRAMDPDADVVVTTYGLLAREQGLKEVPWHRGGAGRGASDQEPGHPRGSRRPGADCYPPTGRHRHARREPPR